MNRTGRKPSHSSVSPARLLVICAFSIITIELLLHFTILNSLPYAEWIRSILDSILLTALIFPVLYFFVFRRLMSEIAERKQAEAELRKAGIRLQTLSAAIEQSPVTTVITDLTGNIVFVNPKFTMTTGYLAEEAIGQNPRILKTGFTTGTEYKELWETILSGQNWHGVFKNKKKDGEHYWESATISPVKDDRGAITHFLAVKEDITVRKQTEEALHESQRFLLQLIENNGAIIFAKDREGRYLLVNKKWEDDIGIKREAAIGKKDSELFSGAISHIHRDSDIQVIETKSIIEVEEVVQDVGGNRFYITIKFPLLDDDNAVLGLCGISTDITGRKQAEVALLESEMRFKSAFQYSPIGMALISPQGNWLKVNSKMSEIVGYSEAELLDKTFQEITYSADLPADLELVRQILAGDIESFRMEKRYIHKGGHLVWVLLAVSLVKDGSGAPLYFISQIEDISERKQAERLSEALYEISKAVYLTANVNELFESIHQLLKGVIPGDNFFIALLADNGGTLSFPYFSDEMDSEDWPDIELEILKSLTLEVLKTRKPLLLNEAQLGDRYLTGRNIFGLGGKPKCWLGVPLIIKEDAIGVMAVLDYHDGGAFAQRDKDLLELAANQIAIGIERKQSEDALRANALELENFNSLLEVSIKQANDLAVRAMEAEELIRESETRYRAVFDTASDAIISADSAGNIVDWNSGAGRLFGYSKNEICGQSITILLPARHLAGHLSGMECVQIGGEKHVIGRTVELEGLRKDGSEIPLELSLSEWQVADRNYYTAVIRDITERRRLKEELQQQAATDELTGVFNRRYFQQLALGELKRANRLKHALAVVLIDIDYFKHINDTHGHAAGDQILLTFTKICRNNIREIDMFARFGGDEFALLLPETGYEQAYVVVERIRLAVAAQSIEIDGRPVSITISSGIANLSGNEETFEVLLSHADQALYRAKETGRNKVAGYNRE